MVIFINDRQRFGVPSWVVDLESFRRWMDADDIPEDHRVYYLKGEVWIDVSKEQVFTHTLVKTRFAAVLDRLVQIEQLGIYLGDGLLLSNETADISVRPDGTFVSNAALESGQARLVEGMEDGYVEMEGTPDLVLEVVSQGSVQKDTVILREGYWQAGIREYWLVDARQAPVKFEILRHGAGEDAPARKRNGWVRSLVLGKSFRFTQTVGRLGHPEYMLEVR